MEDLPDDFSIDEGFGLIDEGWEDCLPAPIGSDPIMTLPGTAAEQQTIGVPVPPADAKPAKKAVASTEGKARRITVWNRTTKRKVSGNAAPMEKNLSEYLRKHPECEMYNGQDKHLTVEEKAQLIAEQNRIPIWNKAEGRKISGNAAPSEKNLMDYLTKHPHCEVYAGQDKAPGGWSKPGSTPSSGASDFPSTASHNVPIPATANVSIVDAFDPANNDPFSDMFKVMDNMDPSGVFSMSGLADSLPMDDSNFMGMAMSGPEDGLSKSVNNYFAAARNSFDDQRFLGTQPQGIKPTSPTEVPEQQAMSPAQKIKLDMAAHGSAGKRGRSEIAASLPEVLGMSFSLQDEDFLIMDEETLGSGGIANDIANDIAHDL